MKANTVNRYALGDQRGKTSRIYITCVFALLCAVIRCKGTQFDPVFADIMVHMIDADVNYDMREK